MKIRTKILALLILGAVMPLSVSYFFVDQTMANRFARDIETRIHSDATGAANQIDDRINWMLDSVLMVIRAIPFDEFTPTERSDGLIIPYRQLTYVTVTALLTQNGKAVVPPYRPYAQEAQAMGRRAVSDTELERFARSVPLRSALKASVAIGPVYYSDDGRPRVAVAAAIAGQGRQKWVLALGLSLSSVCDLSMLEAVEDDQTVKLLDGQGQPICDDVNSASWKTSPLRKQFDNIKIGVVSHIVMDDDEYFAINEHIPVTGWSVLLTRSYGAAYREILDLRGAVAGWIVFCLLVAVIGGVVLSRAITSPIDQLVDYSTKIASGHLDAPVPSSMGGELGTLSAAMGAMAGEIKGWHEELNERVAQRTRELKEAQEQIIKTQKLAALSELGAGLAHEVNNPLTSVIGNAQLLLSETDVDPGMRPLLKDIVDNARRVADVVDHLLRFSQEQWGETKQPVSLERLLLRTVDFYLSRFKENHVQIQWKNRDSVSVPGVERDLQLVCTSLVDNALKAITQDGTLYFDVRLLDGGAVLLSIEDTGCGMSDETRVRAVDPFFSTAPPGSGARGLGLTMVQRIVDEHEATLSIISALGEGTTVNIYFPSQMKVSKA